MIKGEDAFFLRLLFGAHGFEMFAELGDLLFEIGDGCLRGGHLFVLGLFKGGDFAELAFQGERTSPGFFAAGDGPIMTQSDGDALQGTPTMVIDASNPIPIVVG